MGSDLSADGYADQTKAALQKDSELRVLSGRGLRCEGANTPRSALPAGYCSERHNVSTIPQRMEQCQSAAERAETVAEPRWPLRLIYPAFWELRFCLRGPGFGREGIEEKVNDRP